MITRIVLPNVMVWIVLAVVWALSLDPEQPISLRHPGWNRLAIWLGLVEDPDIETWPWRDGD